MSISELFMKNNVEQDILELSALAIIYVKGAETGWPVNINTSTWLTSDISK